MTADMTGDMTAGMAAGMAEGKTADPAAGPGSRSGCAVLPAALVTAYAGGSLDTGPAWSVEAHLPGCPACREVLAGCADLARLARTRAVLLTRVGLPRPGPAQLLARRCGMPEHVTTILAATPSLRRSWLASVALVLAVVVGAAQLASRRWTGSAAPPGTWALLLPFVLTGPLLPLGAVAAAFSAVLDPASQLAAAAPISKIRLLCLRSVAVVAATMIPTMAAALILPGPWWLAVAILLPALAVCAAALAAATVMPPWPAAVTAGTAWIGLVLLVSAIASRPAALLGPAGQLAAAVVLAAAALVVVLRRRHVEIEWMR
jgi:hypothetical protein